MARGLSRSVIYPAQARRLILSVSVRVRECGRGFLAVA